MRLARVACLLAVCPGALAAQGGSIRGVVIDSLHGGVLAGAEVQLIDRSAPADVRVARTDSSGAFAFDGLGSGTYAIGFLHATLDSLGLDPPTRYLAVRMGEAVRLTLQIPSAAGLVKTLCRADVARDSTGLFLGRIRRAGGGRAGRGGLRVTWAELRFSRMGVQRGMPALTTDTGPDGWFAICGVPLDTPVSVRGWMGRDSTGHLELDVPANGLLRRDVFVGEASTEVTAHTTRTVVPRDGMPPTVRHDTLAIVRTSRGAGHLRGRVSTSSGAPLGDARVAVWGTGVETLSGPDGVFELDSVPAGSHTVVARAVGFRPYRAPVDVVPPDTTVHNLALVPFSVALDTVRVKVPVLRETWRTGFDDRRREGQGEFIDDAAITRRNPMQLTDMLQGMRGVNVIPTGPLRKSAVMRGQSGSQCIPALYVDGVRNTDGAIDLDLVVNPTDVAGMEVYPRTTTVPAQFYDARRGCGVIVIWTTLRRR